MPLVMSVGAIVSVLAVAFASQPLVPMTAQLSTVPPGEVSIDLIHAGGSDKKLGCPENTVGLSVPPSNDAFSVTYKAFKAQVGVRDPKEAEAGAPLKNCWLLLRMHVPQGYSYAIIGVDHRGSAHLEAGASGTWRAQYSFQGQAAPGPALVTHQFSGAFDGVWQATGNVDVASQPFSPCDGERNIVINSELRVDAGTSDTATTNSSITMDSTTSSIYRLFWRKCA